jgi:methionyl-tRNA formyltransferase
MHGDDRLKLLDARAVPGEGGSGSVLDGFTVACGEGAVEVLRAQRAGRGPQDAETFLRGHPLPKGTVLG